MNIRRGSAATLLALALAVVTATNVLAATAIVTKNLDVLGGYAATWKAKATAVEATFVVPKIGTGCPTKNFWFEMELGGFGAISPSTSGSMSIALENWMGSWEVLAGATSPTRAGVSNSLTLKVSSGDKLHFRIDYDPATRVAAFKAENLTTGVYPKPWKVTLADSSYYNGSGIFVGAGGIFGRVGSFGTVPVSQVRAWFPGGFNYGPGDTATTTSITRYLLKGPSGRTVVEPGPFVVSATNGSVSTTAFPLVQKVCD